jgi:chromosome segregation ATPase
MSEPIIYFWIGALNSISEPVLYFWIGVLLTVLVVFGAKPFLRSRVARRAMQQLDAAAPTLMADIEADMEQLHSQIAVATRRLEMSVEQMKVRTTSQLAEIGKSSEVIGRLKGELTERSAALAVLEDKQRTLTGQLHEIEADLAIKTIALLDVEKALSDRKAELAKLMAESNVHPTLAKAEARHRADMEAAKAEKALVEERLRQSREECLKLQGELTSISKQVESTWATERMANAVLRERINDVATEVVRVAVALEGLGSPVDALIAGKTATAEAEAAAEAEVQPVESGQVPLLVDGGEDSKANLVHRIRALRSRSLQLPAQN